MSLEAYLVVLICERNQMKIRTKETCCICGDIYYAKGMCKFHYDRKRFKRDLSMERKKKFNEHWFNGECEEFAFYNKNHEKIGTFLVDANMVEKIKDMKWSYLSTGYIAAYKNGKTILLHRFITDCPNDLVVDHLNHNKLDNRCSNLRVCTQKENMENCEYKPGKSKVKGITKTKKGYYIAQKHGIYLGCSKDIEKAKSYL